MKFYHEFINDNIILYQAWVNLEKEKLKNTFSEKHQIMWELGNTLESDKIACYFSSSNGIQIYCDPLTPEEFDELNENIISHLAEYDYLLDEEKSTENTYIFSGSNYETIRIILSARQCKTVQTGKLIPETKNICTFIKEN